MEDVKETDVAAFYLGEAAEDLVSYLEANATQLDRTLVAGLVHELNARYINYAHLVDMAEYAVID